MTTKGRHEHLDRFPGWNLSEVWRITFRAELWRPVEDDPNFPGLVAKYGDRARTEVSGLRTELLREVVTAAGGLLYTLDKIEALLGEMQTYVDEHVPPRSEDQRRPGYMHKIGHPLVVIASFEFVNFLSWLRVIDDRLERRSEPRTGAPMTGLLPALAERPLRSQAQQLVNTFREVVERRLANYVLHASIVPPPFEGAFLTEDHRVHLRVPDRPNARVGTRTDLRYEEERDALTVARKAAQAVEALVDGLIAAFERETRIVDEERARAAQRRLDSSEPDSER